MIEVEYQHDQYASIPQPPSKSKKMSKAQLIKLINEYSNRADELAEQLESKDPLYERRDSANYSNFKVAKVLHKMNFEDKPNAAYPPRIWVDIYVYSLENGGETFFRSSIIINAKDFLFHTGARTLSNKIRALKGLL
jgi:hypothetical protein